MSGALLLQSLILGILLGGLYALLAAGLTLYFGIMRVVMIAHSAFLILAAYLAWWFNRETGIDPLVSLVVTVQRRIPLPYASASLDFFGAQVPVVKLIAFGLAAVALALLFVLLKYTKFGQALRATIQHPEAARLVGINTDRVAGYGFGLGLATAAIGGTALSLDATIYPSLHWHWIGPLMAIIVVGGLGSIPGAAIAALVLGIAQSLLQLPLGPTWAQTVFYVALFATLMFRPQGFFGGRLAQRF
ncbi:MAG: branched-chain amino acid transporter permease [Microbacterium sp.]|nr:branched-chain amino acid transporter permease [Microbacterium sp.]